MYIPPHTHKCMYVCLYLHMYVCMYVCMYVYIYSHLWIYMYSYVHMHMDVYMYTNTHKHTQTHTHTHLNIYIYIYLYIYIYIHMFGKICSTLSEYDSNPFFLTNPFSSCKIYVLLLVVHSGSNHLKPFFAQFVIWGTNAQFARHCYPSFIFACRPAERE